MKKVAFESLEAVHTHTHTHTHTSSLLINNNVIKIINKIVIEPKIFRFCCYLFCV